MPVFDLVPVEIPGPSSRKVFLLEIDGDIPYGDFEKKMNKAGKRKELASIRVYFQRLANGQPIPPNSIKPLKGGIDNDDWKEFELRQKSLRVYFFVIPPDGNIIVMGEYKKSAKDQRNIIARFQEIKMAFKEHYQSAKPEEE